MTIARFRVTKTNESLLRPSSSSTLSDTLRLSAFDRTYAEGGFVGTLHVFERGREPGKVIRRALEDALVAYYPMAGRFVRSEKSGEVEVVCNGEGVWFVEATAECRLEDVKWLEHPPFLIPKEQLFPCPPDTSGMIIMMQVTEFLCGGYTIGFASDHTIADGAGVGQFLNAVADMANGLKCPIVKPIWCREAITDPPKMRSNPAPTTSIPNKYFAIDVPIDTIIKMKGQVLEYMGYSCSTFEALSAKAWQSRARAIKLHPQAELHLLFAADARKLVPLSIGFYGNCVYPMKVTASCAWIMQASIPEIVNLIRNAKSKFPMEFSKWGKGELEEDPFSTAYDYNSIFMSNWMRIGFNDVDHGWGTPRSIAPVIDEVPTPVGFLLRSPAPEVSVRLITQCVRDEHWAVFQERMMELEENVKYD